jgi:spore coat protein U-like protein
MFIMGFYLGSILLTALAFISLPSHAQTATYEFCANENQMCNFSGTRTVRYGANNSFVTRTLSNGVHCSNGTFGDPIFGVVKRCELLST